MIENLKSQFNNWELIIVDDGSTDNSLALAIEVIQTTGQNVRLLSSSINEGRGRALKNGIDAASGDIIVTTEIDCSWGLNVVEDLTTELINTHSHVVIASPHLPDGGMVNVPLNRRILSRLGNKLISMFFRSGVTMNTGMTRAYKREVIQPLLTRENGKEFHLEVLLKLTVLQFRISEIPAVLTWLDSKLSRSNSTAPRKSSTKLFRTIMSHLVFIGIAQPLFFFGALFGVCLIVGVSFVGFAIVQLLVGQLSAFYVIIGLLMILFALIFSGFSVLFYQLREVLRENWSKYYEVNQLPNRKTARELSDDLRNP